MELYKLAKHIKKCLETEECFEYYLEKTIKLCEYTENNNESLKKYYYNFLEDIEKKFLIEDLNYDDFKRSDYFAKFLNWLFLNDIMKNSIRHELFKKEFIQIMNMHDDKNKNVKANLLILKPFIKKLKNYPEIMVIKC